MLVGREVGCLALRVSGLRVDWSEGVWVCCLDIMLS